MPVYMVIDITVHNRELYSQYVAQVPAIIQNYGGRYLARDGHIIPVSGNWTPERLVLIEFETIEQFHRCFQSPEYRELAPLRGQSTTSRTILVGDC